jgi:5'-nucleotidase
VIGEEKMRKLILVTNDDGYDSKGIVEAANAARKFGDVVIAAPKTHQSGKSRAITLREPISVEETEIEGIKTFIVNGTPASCVIIAMEKLLERKPDLVVSGINNGENLAAAMTMSGTLNAAIEAATYGIPALALSLQRPELFPKSEVKFGKAGKIASAFIGKMLSGEERNRLLNVNIPLDADTSTPVMRGNPSRRKLHLPRVSLKRGKYYIDFRRDYKGLENGSDADIVVNKGSVSVTALDYMIAPAQPFSFVPAAECN